MFQCPKCDKQYAAKKSLQRYAEDKHQQQSAKQQKIDDGAPLFRCNSCIHVGISAAALYIHRKREHRVEYEAEKRQVGISLCFHHEWLFRETNCNASIASTSRFRRIFTIIVHTFAIYDMSTTPNYSTMTLNWSKKIDDFRVHTITNSGENHRGDRIAFNSYQQKAVKKYDEYTAETLYCSRCSTTKQIRKVSFNRTDRCAPISAKCDTACTAYLHVSLFCNSRSLYLSSLFQVKHYRNDSVDVSYCLQHIGHDLEFERLRLSDADKDLLRSYLIDQRDIAWILNELASNDFEHENQFEIKVYFQRETDSKIDCHSSTNRIYATKWAVRFFNKIDSTKTSALVNMSIVINRRPVQMDGKLFSLIIHLSIQPAKASHSVTIFHSLFLFEFITSHRHYDETTMRIVAEIRAQRIVCRYYTQHHEVPFENGNCDGGGRLWMR